MTMRHKTFKAHELAPVSDEEALRDLGPAKIRKIYEYFSAKYPELARDMNCQCVRIYFKVCVN